MKTVGMITEYNPYHNGHSYHMAQSKKMTGSDCAIAVMSGSFVQRGEPAITDKWTRARMALLDGADIVIELPVMYSTASAEFFAYAAVKLLHDTGIVSSICFGTENDDMELLKKAASLLCNEPMEFSALLKQELSVGTPFAAARAKALEEFIPGTFQLLCTPNNILAIEYLKAIFRLESNIQAVALKRKGEGYYSKNLGRPNPSATAIRNLIEYNQTEMLRMFIPSVSFPAFCAAFSEGTAPVFPDDLSSYLNYILRTESKEHLAEILDISEGLENRIVAAGESYHTFTEIANAVKSKRYPLTRINRALLHIVLNIKTSDFLYFNHHGFVPYIRILGFRRSSENLLKEICDKAAIPVLTSIKNAETQLDEVGQKMLAMEVKATDIYTLCMPGATTHSPRQDYTHPMVIIP